MAVEARDGGTVVVSNAETGEGHESCGGRDEGVIDDALSNAR